jgi:hypothetical protein
MDERDNDTGDVTMSEREMDGDRVVRYTTAPDAYDGFGTEELMGHAGRDNGGLTVRKVAIRRENLDWQEARYASGCHGSVSPEEAGRFPEIWMIFEVAAIEA